MPSKLPSLTEKDLAYSRAWFERFEEDHFVPERGVMRLGYSKETYQAASLLCLDARRRLGADTYEDLAGVRYIVLEPPDNNDKRRPALCMGSHVDSVNNGGPYDGMAGVIAALQTMKTIVRHNIPFHAPLVAVIFPNEESTRFQFAVSSKASVGCLPESTLDQKDKLPSSETLETAMRLHHQLDTAKLRNALYRHKVLMPCETMASFVEVHIEQSDILANEGYDIGIIDEIKGMHRCGYVRFDGRADHSGACPQEERLDAIGCGSDFNSAVRKHWNTLLHEAPDFTHTFNNMFVEGGGSQNIVSPNVNILFDLRSRNVRVLEKAMDAVREMGHAFARQQGLTFTLNEKNVTLEQPVVMDVPLRQAFERTAQELGLHALTMPSGPNHDAGVLQKNRRASSVLFIPHTGGSHKPTERMTIKEGDDPFALDGGYASAARMLLAYATGHVMAPKKPVGKISKSGSCAFVQSLLARGAKRLTF